MAAKVLFSSVLFDKYEAHLTLPAKFSRLLDHTDLEQRVKGKLTAVKMHLGRNIGFTTIHPLFVKILIDKLKQYGAKPFITDQSVEGARNRGYTEEFLGVPILDACGYTGKYYYEKSVDFQGFKNVDIAGYIYDAEFLIDLSHAKGHGVCGFGGAVKNIAMGCVTDRTRMQIHGLEGGIMWNADLCTHCDACIASCNHYANSFDKNGKYKMNYHHCTNCQHCVKVCPTGAVTMLENKYADFQVGMALCTQEVLKTFAPENAYYINFLLNITALCDCWGLTTPSLVPDIGVMASDDITAIEEACLEAIKLENLIPSGIPQGVELGEKGHLFERLHGKNPYIQLEELVKLGIGTREYDLCEIK